MDIYKSISSDMRADILLSCPGFENENMSVICVKPLEEFWLDESVRIEEIKDFAFYDKRPAVGFISYDYGLFLKGIGNKKSEFPYGVLRKYETYIYFDSITNVMTLNSCEKFKQKFEDIYLKSSAKEGNGTNFCGELTASDSKELYEEKVREVIEQIKEGYTYQLNLALRYEINFEYADSADMLTRFAIEYPAPFYACFGTERYDVLSTSPERFLKVVNGKVLSQPIKGTAKADDKNSYEKLVNSEKESAELSMIVDLIRNDISINCKCGSVKVDNHKSVFRVDNLLQMYSDVSGVLQDDKDVLDLFFDAFPGGSITGCPKMKSMEIIDELESFTRDIYCGSFVIIHDEKNMDSSIAIRTGYFDYDENIFRFYAGSGIVADSDPENEFFESTAKAEKFLKVIK